MHQSAKPLVWISLNRSFSSWCIINNTNSNQRNEGSDNIKFVGCKMIEFNGPEQGHHNKKASVSSINLSKTFGLFVARFVCQLNAVKSKKLQLICICAF